MGGPVSVKDELNRLYGPLEQRRAELMKRLRGEKLPVVCGWYNGHYSLDADGEYSAESFPIPVISLPGRWDMELHFEGTSLTAKLSREAAIALDWKKLSRWRFESYGVEDYLTDYYREGMSPEAFREKLKESPEREIAFSFSADPDRLSELLRFLESEGFYY